MNRLSNVLIIVIWFSGCYPKVNPQQLSGDDKFYQITRFIMSKEEKEIYRHLPDNQAREEFAKDFWAKRDPDPTTIQNESLEEFQKRIDYANTHFRDKRIKERGWDTDRGRILILLGFPDQVSPIVTTLRGSTKQVEAEVWYYNRYQMKLVFISRDGFGQYYLEKWPTRLQSYFEKAKNVFRITGDKNFEQMFKFSLKYQHNILCITLPVKNLHFVTEGEKLNADFIIEINVFHKYRKKRTVKFNRTLSKNKNQLIHHKALRMEIPLILKGKGLFHLETIIREQATGTSYRKFYKIKL